MSDDSTTAAAFTLSIFKLNGQMLEAGERLARPVGLTVAWWQVLGAVLRNPDTASGIARQMGLARQSVQRVANRLLQEGLMESRPNPIHKRASLLAPTKAGLDAIQRIAPGQIAFAERLVEEFGRDRLARLVADLEEMSALVDNVGPDP